jgi:hypothetical protein
MIDQAEVLELHLLARAGRCVPMTTSTSRRQAVDDLLGLGVGLEPGQRATRDGEARVALGEGLLVLLDQQRRRHEHGDLLAVLDALNAARTAISVLP